MQVKLDFRMPDSMFLPSHSNTLGMRHVENDRDIEEEPRRKASAVLKLGHYFEFYINSTS